MIRPYSRMDFALLDGNEFIDNDLYGDRLASMLGDYYSYTLEDNGEILSIMAFREYCEGCYSAFLLCSRHFGGKYAKEVKRFLQSNIELLGATRVETLSLKNDKITRFHEFLGFELEGTKRQFFNGNDYNMWSWVREA